MISDITALNADRNEKRPRAKQPWRYIRGFGIRERELRNHCVPEPFPGCEHIDGRLREVWDLRTFPEFLLARAQELAQGADAFVEELKGRSWSDIARGAGEGVRGWP